MGQTATPKGLLLPASPPATGNLRWANDLREALPGDGVVPLKEGIEALRATGYDDVWTAELYSFFHSEWSPTLVAHEVKRRMDALLAA